MEKRPSVQTLDRALRILRVLASSPTALTVSRVAASVSIPSSTAHRLLGSLREHDLVRYNAAEHTYGVGLGVLSLAHAVQVQIPIQELAQPLLEQLAVEVNETATLTLVEGTSGTYSAMARSSRSMLTTARLGEKIVLHASAAGKVILAYMEERALQEYIDRGLARYTPNSIADPDRLLAELERVCSARLAFDNEEREPGMRCIAAPVFDHDGELRAAVGIAGPSSRILTDPDSAVAGHVRRAAYDLSRLMGYQADAISQNQLSNQPPEPELAYLA